MMGGSITFNPTKRGFNCPDLFWLYYNRSSEGIYSLHHCRGCLLWGSLQEMKGAGPEILLEKISSVGTTGCPPRFHLNPVPSCQKHSTIVQSGEGSLRTAGMYMYRGRAERSRSPRPLSKIPRCILHISVVPYCYSMVVIRLKSSVQIQTGIRGLFFRPWNVCGLNPWQPAF
jgi:hypothetical protein